MRIFEDSFTHKRTAKANKTENKQIGEQAKNQVRIKKLRYKKE